MITTKQLVLAIIVIIVAWLVWKYVLGNHMYEKYGNMNDTTKFVTPPPSNTNDGLIHPLTYQPELSAVISASNFIGLPESVYTAYAPDSDAMIRGYWTHNKNNYGETDTLDGDLGEMSLEYNLCSKSCCSSQYPNGIDMKPDEFVCGSPDKFVPTTYTCNNAYEDSGCVCMTQKQMDFLNRRGGNA